MAQLRPDVPRLLALLRAPEAEDDFTDILVSLLACEPEDAPAVQAALVQRAVGETDTLMADAIGEALGALWARFGPPSPETMDELPEVTRTAASVTMFALRRDETQAP